MFKIMLIASSLFQLLITTSVELLGNERGEVDLTPAEIATNEAKVIADNKAIEVAKQSKIEATRELSKELGINAFDPKELKTKFDEFTKWQIDQKSEQEILQEQVNAFKTKETEWESTQLKYASELMASKLNIADDNLEDVMKLAGNDPSKFEEVVKKYPNFKSKTGIHIGVNENNGAGNPSDMSDTEKYMAANPKLYGQYIKK